MVNTMEYIIKSETLYRDSSPVCSIQPKFLTFEKQIKNMETNECTQIKKEYTQKNSGDIRNCKYVISNNNFSFEVYPDYDEKEDPKKYGWPVNRLPKISHIHIQYNNKKYQLFMNSNTNYSLIDDKNTTICSISHRGIKGGWQIITSSIKDDTILASIYVLCRFLELENEFPIV